MSRLFALFLALFVSSAALAEDVPVDGPADPPAQIGRLTAISGAVSYFSTAMAAPDEAAVNYPLTTGNRLATPPRGHAVVDIAAGRFYLDGASAATIGTLGPGIGAIVLEQGAVILRILPGGAGQVFTIETPRGTLRADQPGYFEVEIAPETGTVIASALEGGAQFDMTVLPPGTRATVAKDAAPALDAAVQDDFIRRIAADVAQSGDDKLEAPKYVSPQVTGYQELSRDGLWEMTEKYGPVWEPQVASDWAPFRDGRWVEIAPWGPTWIDNAAWGFAPSHYGRWVEVNDRWAWVPGNAALAPIYAPAVVSFFGAQGKDGKSAVGWVPLGPEEPYFPAYPVTVNYVRVINQPSVPKIVNVTNVNTVTNVTNVVKETRRQPVLVIDRLVNRGAATSGQGSISVGSGGASISVGGKAPYTPTTPAAGATSPSLNMTGGARISNGSYLPSMR